MRSTYGALLGIGALVSALLGRLVPSIDLEWLPDIDAPTWLRYLDPSYWLGQILPDIDLPNLFAWVPDIPPWAKYVVLVLIAAGAGLSEVRKRQERDRRERDREPQERERDAQDNGPPQADRPD